MTEQEMLDRFEALDGQLLALGLAVKSILRAHPEAGTKLRQHMDWGMFLNQFGDMPPVKREAFLKQVEMVMPR